MNDDNRAMARRERIEAERIEAKMDARAERKEQLTEAVAEEVERLAIKKGVAALLQIDGVRELVIADLKDEALDNLNDYRAEAQENGEP